MSSADDADDLCARLERIKKLCDQLDAARGDAYRFSDILDTMKREADLFRRTLDTQDPGRA